MKQLYECAKYNNKTKINYLQKSQLRSLPRNLFETVLTEKNKNNLKSSSNSKTCLETINLLSYGSKNA